ncbi:MAG: acetate--CoA ligase family protein [Polaromonas sp.]|nr:acetate--CoA ligase family protein [Burkholderiaceae bacterium]MDP3170942.1 acetate--CoA ligase family protein [Polaromonas sp.]
MPQLIDAVFRPKTIALIGASADAGKHSALPQKHLILHGYTGSIYPINPRRDVILGLKAYPKVSEVPSQVDHAYIMLPTEHVLSAVEDCIAAKVPCVTIMSNGFSEAGSEGIDRQEKLLGLLAGSQTRLLGPNALGVVDLHAHVALSANEVLSLTELPAGDVGLISQSGSMLGAILSRGAARGVGYSKLVSVGNEADISIAELIEMMVEDPETQVIQLFLETIRSHETLRRAAMKAHAANKPILAYRLGRSAIGQNLAVSHTGALTGNGKATSAFLRDIGIAELSNFEALLDAPALFRHGRGAGSRIGVMSTTGGGGALIVDNLGERHIDVVSPTPQMQANLACKGIEITDAPLVDLTLAGTNAATYGAVLSEFVQSPDIDAVVAVVGSSSQFRPERAVAPILDIPSSKPVAVFLTPNAERSRQLLREAGVAVFSQPEACADALSAWARWQEPRHHTGGGPTTVKALDGRAPGQTLSSVDSQQVFASLGIPQAQEWALPPEPASWDALLLGQVLFPCVLKISSSDIPHKTEVGGVKLGIGDVNELRSAAQAMLERIRVALPSAAIDGFQVQEMVQGLAEVLVGYSRDPAVGPIVSVGLGGVLAELYQDVSIRPAPVSAEEARKMLGEVKAFAQLSGYRNLPLGDLDALADVVAKVSTLAECSNAHVAEAEINPLVVLSKGRGVRALDGLVVLGELSALEKFAARIIDHHRRPIEVACSGFQT